MDFISPPFGNYLNLDKCISIKGSFTLEPRDGLFKQIIKTLYFDTSYWGWVNSIDNILFVRRHAASRWLVSG